MLKNRNIAVKFYWFSIFFNLIFSCVIFGFHHFFISDPATRYPLMQVLMLPMIYIPFIIGVANLFYLLLPLVDDRFFLAKLFLIFLLPNIFLFFLFIYWRFDFFKLTIIWINIFYSFGAFIIYYKLNKEK